MATAPSVPTGLTYANATASAVDLSCNPSTNASALKTGGWTGCLYGISGSYQQVLTHESKIGRAVGMFRSYLGASGKAADAIGTADDLAMAFGGKLSDGTSTLYNGAVVQRIPYFNMIPHTYGHGVNAALFGGAAPVPSQSTKDFGGGGTADVWSLDQVGQCDINGNITAAGVIDPIIASWANSMMAFPGLVFFNYNHENDVTPNATSGSSAIWRSAHYGSATPTQATRLKAAAAHRYVIKKIKDAYTAAGATLNVVFPWIVSDYRGGPTTQWYKDTYPGSAWVDWIGWDPYDHANAPTSSAGKISAMYNDGSWYTGMNADPFEAAWTGTTAHALNDIVVPTVSNSHFYKCTVAGTTSGSQPTWPTTSGGTVVDGTVTWTEQGSSSGGKPRMLGEVGCSYRNDGTRASVFFADLVNAQTTYPKMKAITYFEGGSWGDLHTFSGGKITTTWDTAALTKMASSATGLNNSLFKPDPTTGGSGVGGYRIYDNGTQISSISGNPAAPTKHLTGLAAGTHTFQMTSIDTSGSPLESAKSAVLTVTLVTPPAAPNPPVLSVAAATLAPQARLSFTGPGPGGTRIYRSDDGGSTWTLKYTAAAGVASFTTNDLAASPSPAYQFKARGLDATGQVESADSNIVSFAGAANNPQPLPVSGLTGVQVTSGALTNVVLTWTLSTDPNRSLVAIYENLDPNDPTNPGAAPTVLLGANVVTWTDTAVPPSTTRTYYVVPTSGAGVLAPSTSITQTTPTSQVTANLTVSSQLLTLAGDGTPAVFTMDASASTDSLGLPLRYTFSVNDGAPDVGPLDNSGNPISPVQPRSELTAGTYTVNVTATDSQGQSDTATATVTIAPPGGATAPYLALQLLTNNLPFGPPSTTQATAWDAINNNTSAIDSWAQSIGSGGTIPYWQPVSGEYVWIDGLQGWVNTQLAAGSHQLQQWTRLKIPTNTAFSAVGLNVTTGGTGGTQAAVFSLYADDGTGRNPGAWIQNSASVSLLSTGWQEDAAFSYTSGGVPGRYMYVWVSSTLTLTSVGTYATVSMVNNAPMLPGMAGAFLNRGLAQSSVSSPVNPVVLGSLTRTATPILVGLKLA